MTTRLTFIGAAPAPTTGADIVGNGPLSPAKVDQNFANVRAAVDNLAASQTVAQMGTYTPTVTCAGGGSAVFSTCTGRYTKRDDVVTVTIRLVVSSVSSPTGALMISAPFAGASGVYPTAHVYANGLTVTGAALTALLQSGNIYIYEDNGGNISSTAGQRLKAGSEIVVTASYFV